MPPTYEFDLWLMSLIIFFPALVAVVLTLPFGNDEWIRWSALLGTAVTLTLSVIMFISYLSNVNAFRMGSDPDKLLPARAERVLAEEDSQGKAHQAYDWIAKVGWIPRFNINYYLGIDGISLPLILLTTVLSFLAMLASWNIEKHVRGYCILFLILETGMLGVFFALDFFLFFIFWEVMLLPMYFLIGVWGGPRREYAAIKFFLYTLLGGVFMLVAMLGFYFTNVRDFVPQHLIQARMNQETKNLVERGMKPADAKAEVEKNYTYNTFDLLLLAKVGMAAAQFIEDKPIDFAPLPQGATDAQKAEHLKAANARLGKKDGSQPLFFQKRFQVIMFLLLFIGFAIKVPVFPFHTWLPDAHVEAPTPISMILAGVLLKLGGYGILRVAYPICPWAAYFLAMPLAIFGLINIVYGAFAAMAQTDFKKLVAYSSISHMGYVILGIAVWSASGSAYWNWGMTGAMYQMIAHGVSSAGMFFLVGVIYDRAHHRNLDNFRGLLEPMPVYGGISAIIFFAALGLPGLCGFVGEFMVVLSTWNYSKPIAIIAALTVVLTAAYILWTMQRVYFGTNPAYKDYPDVNFRELLCIIPLVILSVLLGIMPSLVLDWMEPSVSGLVSTLAQIGK